MNGDEKAVGKKAEPVRYVTMALGIAEIRVVGSAWSTACIGLYPRKAAKIALEAGVAARACPNCAGAPRAMTAEVSAVGRLVFSEDITMAKNNPWPMVNPEFCSVCRMPEAAPRWAGGTEFMIEVVLGDRKSPFPIPIRISANAKVE